MTAAKGTGLTSTEKSAQEEWRAPGLRKLPIAATAAGTSLGNEGNTKKDSGTAGGFS